MHFLTLIGRFSPHSAQFILLVAALTGWTSTLLAQSTYLSPDEDQYHLIDRYEATSGVINNQFFTGIKPYKRQAVVAFFGGLDSLGLLKSRADKFNRDYFTIDSWEFTRTPERMSDRILPWNIYKAKSDFGHVDTDGFDLHMSPVLYVGYGKDNTLSEPVWQNTRGIELRATIDGKVGVYTFISENQAMLPGYVQQTINPYRVIPHETLWKDFNKTGVDFINARAHLSFKATRHIDIQFGHDRNIIGNGYRSLVLSDYSAPYLFLKANLKVWKLNYQYMISRLNADIITNNAGTLIRGRYPQKFFAFHEASINIGKKVNLAIFESVIFSPRTKNGTDYFDLGYLNPVIFYRSVEQQFGSPDNVILGFDAKWIVRKGLTAYGQFIIDEFVVSEILAGNGWWGNKFAAQVGLKAIDLFGIRNLDLQVEGNLARPYTYSQGEPYLNYSHYRQPLAHPVGANFREAVAIVRYQPHPRVRLSAKGIYYMTGKDATGGTSGNNDYVWGGDILKLNNVNRPRWEGNVIGQGLRTTVLFSDLTASWMVRHNLFLDLRQIVRKSDSALPALNTNTSLTAVALRLNFAKRDYEF